MKGREDLTEFGYSLYLWFILVHYYIWDQTRKSVLSGDSILRIPSLKDAELFEINYTWDISCVYCTEGAVSCWNISMLRSLYNAAFWEGSWRKNHNISEFRVKANLVRTKFGFGVVILMCCLCCLQLIVIIDSLLLLVTLCKVVQSV